MNPRHLFHVPAVCVLSAVLAACGGGEGVGIASTVGASTTPTTPATTPTTPTSPTVAATLTSPERLSAFVSGYNSGLGALTSAAGLASSSFIDLFDDRYLDAGQTKQQVRDSLAQDAEALGNGTGLPVAAFPAATLADTTVSNCNESTGICTLTTTVVNSDVDTTRATISTQVRFSDGKFRLYGDQQVAAL